MSLANLTGTWSYENLLATPASVSMHLTQDGSAVTGSGSGVSQLSAHAPRFTFDASGTVSDDGVNLSGTAVVTSEEGKSSGPYRYAGQLTDPNTLQGTFSGTITGTFAMTRSK